MIYFTLQFLLQILVFPCSIMVFLAVFCRFQIFFYSQTNISIIMHFLELDLYYSHYLNRENGQQNPCQGKHGEFENFAKTQGIVYAHVVNFLILKVKDTVLQYLL